jgi:hypothetical protein
MPSQDHAPRTWEEVAEAASQEKDPIKLASLIEELSDALSAKQMKSSNEKKCA